MMSPSYRPEGHLDASVLPLLHHHLGILKTDGKKNIQAKVPFPTGGLHQELQEAPSTQELKIAMPFCTTSVNETLYSYIRPSTDNIYNSQCCKTFSFLIC